MRRLLNVVFITAVSCCVASGRLAVATELEPVRFEASGEGTAVVAHPTDSKLKVLAIDVSGVKGTHKLKSNALKLAPGKYRVTLHAMPYTSGGDDFSRLRATWVVGSGASQVKQQYAWTQFDSTPKRFTPLELELTLLSESTPAFELNWQQVAAGPGEKVKPIRKTDVPSVPKNDPLAAKKKPKVGDDEDLLGELTASKDVAPFASVTYPALLIERVVVEPISRSQFVESVRPQFLHVYPGEKNPVAVTVRNVASEPVKAVARLEILVGLGEVLHTAEQPLELPANGVVSHKFEWPATSREYGYETRVTLLVNGKPTHAASDYFTASTPVWKTALQANGFLDWYGREQFFPEHVASNRAKYLNVEEAFSWQPSSWTDLTPDTDHWWTGQGDAHNSLAGLKQWIGLSHKEGIKMITYLWPTASGPEAIEWAREAPELITHGRVGLPSEFFDVEDLRLKSITESDKRLWELRSGIWNYLGVNRGMLRCIDKGTVETVESAKKFGWDGARFDSPPSWSAMSGEDMHSEFKRLKVEPLMKQLVPEYFGKTTGEWDQTAVSVTNARYTKHQMRKDNPHFALSYNFGAVQVGPEHDTKFFDNCCADGGQIMDEAIRQFLRAPWSVYYSRIREQVDIARRRGGHNCVVAMSTTLPAARCYSAICTLAGGSHPYSDFGWATTMPGNYTQFMTRYGEFCWSLDLEPVEPAQSGFKIDDEDRVWWGKNIRRRATPNGGQQWVLQLISTPPTETVTADQPGKLQPWRRGLKASRTSSVEPTVWALSAEPTTRAMQLKPKREGNRYIVELPEHRLWTVLVWTEPSSAKSEK